MGNAQPSLEHLHSSLLLQSFETWLESKLQQIGVHLAIQDMLIFMCWHDAKRSNISVFLFFFSGWGGCVWMKICVFHLWNCLPDRGLHLSKELFCCTPTVDCLCRVFRKKSVDEISSHLIYPSQLFHVNEEMEVFVSHQSCEVNARLAAWKCWNPLTLILE